MAFRTLDDIGEVRGRRVLVRADLNVPMQDGRVKPDLVAFGDMMTLIAGLNETTTSSGTSFSCPGVAGMAALPLGGKGESGQAHSHPVAAT